MLPEDSYGRLKRQSFVEAAIREAQPRTVLDFGCGTGAQLTGPLAAEFPAISFHGADVDPSTIAWARRHSTLPNLTFGTPDSLPEDQRFDMIIASEVLEHVDDPPSLLRNLHCRLADGGRLIVTVPNGYGPFEAMALVEALLTLGGILPLLRRLKALMLGPPPVTPDDPATLANSPHINFFTRPALSTLLDNAGFPCLRFQPRTVFCGFVFDWIVRGRIAHWNARLGDRLPAWCASDWMFVCSKSAPSLRENAWRRSSLARWRRRVSEARWGLPRSTA